MTSSPFHCLPECQRLRIFRSLRESRGAWLSRPLFLFRFRKRPDFGHKPADKQTHHASQHDLANSSEAHGLRQHDSSRRHTTTLGGRRLQRQRGRQPSVGNQYRRQRRRLDDQRLGTRDRLHGRATTRRGIQPVPRRATSCICSPAAPSRPSRTSQSTPRAMSGVPTTGMMSRSQRG